MREKKKISRKKGTRIFWGLMFKTRSNSKTDAICCKKERKKEKKDIQNDSNQLLFTRNHTNFLGG